VEIGGFIWCVFWVGKNEVLVAWKGTGRGGFGGRRKKGGREGGREGGRDVPVDEEGMQAVPIAVLLVHPQHDGEMLRVRVKLVVVGEGVVRVGVLGRKEGRKGGREGGSQGEEKVLDV